MQKRKFTIILSFCLIPISLFGFPLLPRITNYSHLDYKAGNQNWAVTQDTEGRIYVGNTRGVLEFDGINWQLHQLPNKEVVRCVYYSKDKKLYVGSYEEFGYYIRDKYNRLVYHSLKELVKNYTFHNDEIWNIVEYQGNVYFQYFSSYFRYNGTTVEAFKGIAPLNLFLYREKLMSQIIGGSLSVYSNQAFQPLIDRSKYGDDDIISVLPYQGNSLLVTRNKGIFLYNTQSSTTSVWGNSINENLKSASVNKVSITKDSCFIIGTLSNGIYALSNTGELMWKMNVENGLPNNTVLSLYCDMENNIWVGLDNGISKIHYNSDIYLFEPQNHHFGMVNDALIMEDESYIASNQGLFHYQNKTQSLHKVPHTEGLAWSVSKFDNQIIYGHNTGTFTLDNGQQINLSQTRGAKGIRKTTIHKQDILLQNTYTFLNIYKRGIDGKWYYANKVNRFMHLIQHIEVDHQGNIWAEHMHKGVYRINLSEDLQQAEKTKFYDKIGEKENGRVTVAKIQGRIVFVTQNGFYTYDDLNDTIIKHDQLDKELSILKNTYRIVQESSTKYWFIDNLHYTMTEYTDGHFNIKRQIPMSIFDNSPVDNKGNVFFTEDGNTYLALNGALGNFLRSKPYTSNVDVKLCIKEIVIYDANKKTHYLPLDKLNEIEYDFNNIIISLYSPFGGETGARVRYRLDGLDNEGIWYDDLYSLKKEYSRLPFGEYTFVAELYTNQDVLSRVEYPFIIERPYYLSYTAIGIYILLAIALILLIIVIIYSRINNRKNREIQAQKRLATEKIERQQKQIIELEKSQLEADLRFKSKELANFTMLSIRNKEFLIQIRENLNQQQIKGQPTKQFLNNMIRLIDENISSDDDWAIFQSNFDRIHENFFRNLKNKYPDLTPNDLRLCALLRLNLSTKDISNMMNISIRGIEAARYRLRKRLNIPTEQDLVDFMIEFK